MISDNTINKKYFFQLILTFIISTVFVYYALKDFKLELFINSIRESDFRFIFLSMVILIIVVHLRSIRWKFLINKNININILYIAQLIGSMGNNILPFRFGEFLKSYYLGKKSGISKYEAFGSVILERVLDFLGLGFLFLILIPSQVLYKLNNIYLIIVTLVIAISIIAFILSLYLNNKNDFINRKFSRIIKEILSGFSNMNYSNLFYVLLLTILIWTSYLFVVYIMQKTFMLNLGINGSILLLVISTIILSVPSLPGNIGTFEGAVVYTLSLYGIEDSFGFGFILHSVSYIPYTLLGLIYFLRERKIILK
jgi:uncharacterized protein (TIRG00374 family)